MRFKGKKPIFSYKDTWSMCDTLNPIIYEGLLKFADVVEEKNFGVPCQFLNEYYPDYCTSDDGDLPEGSLQAWSDLIREMAYGFCDDEPDISDYDFSLNIVQIGRCEKTGLIETALESNNESDRERYHTDVKLNNERKEKARELFAKYYECLWW